MDALAKYGGEPFVLLNFIQGFLSALFLSRPQICMTADFFGAFFACLIFAMSEVDRQKSLLAWSALVISPLGLFTTLFFITEGVRIWRSKDGSSQARSPDMLRFILLLYIFVAVTSLIVDEIFLFGHFGLGAWLALFNPYDANVASFTTLFMREPSTAALGAQLGPLTLATIWALIVYAIETRRWVTPLLMAVVIMPLGVSFVLPAFLAYREARPARLLAQ